MRYLRRQNKQRFILLFIFAPLFFSSVSLAGQATNPNLSKNTPHFSADGDTAYLGKLAIEKSNGHEHPSTTGALLGTAPQGTVTSVTWGPEVRLTISNDSQFVNSYPFGAVCNDTLLVYFAFGLDWPIDSPYLMQSSDAGANWGLPWNITNPDTAYQAAGMFIRLHHNSVITAAKTLHTRQYPGQNIYVKRSTNRGVTWGQPFFFFSHSQGLISWHAGTANGDSVIFIFRHGSDDDNRIIDSLKVSRSFNDGATWSPALNVFYHQDDAYLFFVRYSMGRIHLVYQDYSSANTEIFYSQSADWGVSWSDPMAISDNIAPTSQWPYLFATTDGRLIVSWYDYKYGSGGGGFLGDILFRLSLDNGTTWGPEMRLTNDHNNSASRSFILGDHIGMIYEKGLAQPDLYYAESSDIGETWSEETNLTNSPGASSDAELLLNGHNLYLFWDDARDDPPFNEEIYFRKAEVQVSVDQNEEMPIPNEITLSAYPNPFNSSTTISLNSIKDTRIIIYDISGKQVAVLRAEGGRAVWDASGYSSGVYFARVQAGNNSQSIKLVLLK